MAGAQESVRIPLAHRGKALIANTITIRIAGGPPVPVLLDTGSSGLRVLSDAIGPGLRRTERRVHDTFGDGTVVEGYIGYARVDFPDAEHGLATGDIAIQVIERVKCRPDRPHCPGISALGNGIMGVDYSPAGPLFNPLAQLPAPLGDGFVVDVRQGQQPHLRVGLSARDQADFRFAPMAPGTTSASGQRGWNTTLPEACYAVDARPVGCQPVIFDTGGSSMHFSFNDAPPHLVRRGHLSDGHRVFVQVKDVLELTETTGLDSPVRLAPKRRSNSGEAFFRHFAVLFDAVRGRIGFLR